MSKDTYTVQTVNRIPMFLAVALTVIISLPFGFFLGKWNFTLWVCFIVWTEYFIFGSKPFTAKLIFPAIPLGGAIAAAWYICALFVTGLLPGENASFWAHVITGLIWMSLLIMIQDRVPLLQEGTLAYFNGLSLTLGVFGTACYPDFGPLDNPYWSVVWAFIWTVLMCYFGWVLGWLNVTITFPKEVSVRKEEA